ncbi:MAG: hypothetical protein FP833_00515 [Atribacteria sp.]|nr:hypothetical protein [Candidatus Atribacteria bacterium]
MVVRKKKIKINGKEIEIDAFDTSLIPGSGTEEQAIERLLKEEEIEKEIKNVIVKVKKISDKHPNKEKNIQYYYEVGQVLQFVDKKNFTNEKGKIWQRLAYDLEPQLFVRKKKNPNEAKRHPEFMYLLGKVSLKYITKVSWDQWYEILKFKDIYKDEKFLDQVLSECADNSLSRIPLRNKIKELRKSKR